ncbi:MAG: 60S ribosomal protein L23A [Amphiamblys sp. WSBS2006]|nr:MAG: 60S ribosomal protein L23A [Amphiamblys sp. WSBS2006]
MVKAAAKATKTKKMITKGYWEKEKQVHVPKSGKLKKQKFNAEEKKKHRKMMVAKKNATPKTKIDEPADTIRFFLNTEKAMRCMEKHNTLVLICDISVTKPKLREIVAELYKVKACKVNTMIRPQGDKKAYVKLAPEFSAVELASTIGLI